MADKKLTVGETKKALEHCAGLPCLCSDCILFEPEDDDCQCSRNLKLNALDLINRLKARIKELEERLNNK